MEKFEQQIKKRLPVPDAKPFKEEFLPDIRPLGQEKIEDIWKEIQSPPYIKTSNEDIPSLEFIIMIDKVLLREADIKTITRTNNYRERVRAYMKQRGIEPIDK